MPKRFRSVMSPSGARLFSALVIVSLVFSVLSAFPPPVANAQDGETPTPTAEAQESEAPAPTAEAQEGGVSTYIAEKHNCPVGFDPAAGDASAALAGCAELTAGVAFSLSTQDPNYPGDTRASGGDGVAAWSDIPLGAAYSVTEAIPAGFGDPWVYCEITGGPGDNQFLFFQAAGGSMDVGLSNPALTGYGQAYCRWFNVPLGDPNQELAPDDGDPEDPPPPVEVGAFNYLCPPGTSIEDTTREDLAEICTIPGMGVEFTLTPSEGKPRSDPLDADGLVLWSDVPAGPLTVSWATSPGYELGPAYCHPVSPPDLPDAFVWEPFPVENGTISYDLPGGYALFCEFYNLPAAETESEDGSGTLSATPVAVEDEADSGSVIVHGYVCNGDFLGEPFEELQASCQVPNYGAEVHLYSAASQTSLRATIVDSANLSFPAVPPGEAELNFPTAEDQLFCRAYPHGESNPPGFAEASVDIDVQAGEETECYWFSFLSGQYENSSTIDVYTHLCAETPPLDNLLAQPITVQEVVEELRAACPEPDPGVSFYVTSDGAVAFTSSAGSTGLADLFAPPGDLNVVEIRSGESQGVYVYCEIRDEGKDPAYVNAGILDDGESGVPLGNETEPHHYYCDWFTAPVEDDTETARKAGSVIVNNRICPPGFGTIAANYVDIAMYCVSEGGVEFKVTQGETVLSSTSGPDGLAKITGAPSGPMRISELPREGYDPPKVFCLQTAEGAGEVGEPTQATVDSWGLAYDLPEGYYVQCVWANMPAATASTDPGTVILHAYTCPEGTGEYDALENLLAACSERPEGLKFTAGQFLGVPAEGTTGPGGEVQITGIAPGFNSVEVVRAQGYKAIAAWCDYYTSATGSAGDLGGAPAQPLRAFMVGGYTLECNWFNVPYVEPSTITILQRLCTTNIDAFVVPMEEILANCTTTPSGVGYQVRARQDVQDEPYEVSQTTDATGRAVFENAPPDIFDIAELSQRYQTARIFCEQHDAGSGQAGSYSDLPSTDDQLLYDASESGVEVNCYWISYELPKVDVGINAYLCLPYYEFAFETLENLGLNCQVTKGIDFAVISGDGSYDRTVATSVTGLAVFSDAPPGKLVMNKAPSDHRTVRVFCGTGAGINSLEFASDAAEYVAEPGKNVVCHWFTIDTTYARIALNNIACPEGYDVQNRTYEELLQACSTPLEDVRFDIGGSYSNYGTTSAEGITRFGAVTPGPVTITQTPPEYPGVVVFCRDIVPGSPMPDFAVVPVENYTIERQVEGGNELDCSWFSYEVKHAKITIHKYGCEEGFTPGNRTDEALLQECPTPLEGVEFLLGGPAAEISRVTDASGSVVWDEVQPGPVFITETPPASFTGATVICRVVREASAQVPVNDFTIELQVESGKSIECVWLNYQEHTDTPTPGTPTPPTPVPPSGGGGGNGGSGGSGGNGGGQLAGPDPDPDAPARLIIRNHTCEPGYEVHHPESDPVKDCEELTDDVEFTIAAEDELENVETRVTGGDGAGTVEFGELKAGAYILTETLPEDIWLAFTYTCASDQREFQQENPFMPFAYAGPDGRIGVVLVAGETLECEWYNVPDQQSTVTITAYWCEEEVVVPSTCDLYTGGIDFTLMPLDDGEDIPLLTGEDGTATAEAEGIYELVQEGFEWCFAESEAMGADGNLTIGPGEQVAVSIYNCGPQPGS